MTEELLTRFLPRIEFDSYEDFKENYSVTVPEHFNFAYDVVDAWADLDPEKEALYWVNDHGQKHIYTFSEISRLSKKAANVLYESGIRRGDRVLLILRQRPEVWVMLVALHRMGAVAIPATFQSTAKDIVYRCNAANVRAICTVDDEYLLDQCVEALPQCKGLLAHFVLGEHIPEGALDLRALLCEASEQFEPIVTENSDTMLIYFSSGTTGMPKMIRHDYTYPLGHIVTAKYWQCVQNGKRHLTASDSGWAKFAWGKIYGQWICGAVIAAYDEERFTPHNFLSIIADMKLTTFCAPPTIYRFLIKEDLSRYDLSSIEHCTTAGEPLNPEVFNRFKELTGLSIREGFGQSESSVLIANFPWFDQKLGSTGKPSPLYDLEILDENGNLCEDGVVGSIVIRNARGVTHPLGLFREYLNDDAAMAKAFSTGGYNTGDTAWRDADGHLWFEGRGDDIIKCSGYRIGPFEVESALMTHPSVLECAVTAYPDPVRGEVVKATILLARGHEPSDELKKELQTHVKQVTAPYKYPRIIEFVDALPKTSSGKIQRTEIRRRDMERLRASETN